MTTKEKIVDMALTLFSTEGYESVSVSRITGELGLAKSTLYSHFKSKEEILEMIYRRYHSIKEEMRKNSPEQINDIEKLNILEFWRGIQKKYMKRWNDPFMLKINRFLILEQFKNPVAMKIIMEETQGVLSVTEEVFKMQIALGKLNNCDAKAYSIEYVYALRGLMMEYDILRAHNLDCSGILEKIDFFIENFFKQSDGN